jgi:hypothetical protein
MIDYIVYYKYYIDDLKFNNDTIITLEDNCPTSDFLEEIILEKLREQLEVYDIEILEIKPLIDRDFNVEDL